MHGLGYSNSHFPVTLRSRVYEALRLSLLATAALVPALAQLTTGTIEGTLRAPDGHAIGDAQVLVIGGAGLRGTARADATGAFAITVPYGQYELSVAPKAGSASVFVAPLQITHVDLVMDGAGTIHIEQSPVWNPGTWTGGAREEQYPEGFSLAGMLLNREPDTVTEPLNFTGLSDTRPAVASQRGMSWTDTQYRVQGMNATDSYQPGLPLSGIDVQALEEVVVRSGFQETTLSGNGAEAGAYVAEPGGQWHGAFSTFDTGAGLSSTNLPAPASRGLVQQADEFRWLTRDHLEAGGPLSKWADVYESVSGQWSSQTVPLAAPGNHQGSRALFENARGRVRASDRDRFDALYSGAHVDLSGGGIPAGLEAWTGSRMAPSFVLPGGFSGEPERNHFDFLQAGWTHLFPEDSGAGVIEARYGYSNAHPDTSTAATGLSQVELLGGTVSGAAPLANAGMRKRQQIEAVWQPRVRRAMGMSHQVVAGGGWTTSEIGNRFTAPSDENLITAAGARAFVVDFNTPDDSRALVRSFLAYAADHLNWTPSLSIDVGILGDFSRGSLPEQSSLGGAFTAARTISAQPDLIVWNSLSPRAGFAWRVPHLRGLTVRGTYFRVYTPLAGRYLDFRNPNSLGGSVYQWVPSDTSPDERGDLLLRFGGPYSSLAPALRRPYSDEFDVGAESRVAGRMELSVHLFRRDDKDRIADIDTGVPAQAFTPVSILDPGPDGIPGTFDDQRLTVYAQNPATLGQDRYLLTNPAGLRTLNSGFLATGGTQWRRLMVRASFLAEKSYGPTNPGDAVYENDPGVIGSLFLDPNTAIHAAGRSFVDRAYVGKVQATYRLPSALGGMELASVADYMDGLAFARQLLVTGLPQGPFLVATTVRGSPNGGNRAQYAANWNLRVGRQFGLPAGRIRVSADLLNVTNGGQRLQESDISGPSFNMRLPVAIQAPRFLRLGFRYEF